MSNHERLARIEGIDLDTGQFSMTLATEGEASDGHILSIKGGQIPERMPMLNSHFNSPTETLGSITSPVKHLKDSPPRLRALGTLEMGGEEPGVSIRRDLAYMIDKGHVTGVSIRWDEVPGKTIRRVNLPADHPHFVDEKTAQGPERWGSYFEEWVGREGSIVALGADKDACIGRAAETEAEVSAFWRAMAEAPEDGSPTGKIAASLAGLRINATECLEAGASHADCINAVTDGTHSQIEAVELGDFIVFLPQPEADAVRALVETDSDIAIEFDEEEPVSRDEMTHLLERLEALETALDDRAEPEDSPPSQEREEADPLPASEPTKSLAEEIRELIVESDRRQEKFSRDLIDRARGKVT
jgi:hypothetical protein